MGNNAFVQKLRVNKQARVNEEENNLFYSKKSRRRGRAEGTFIPHRWARCDVNQIDDESLG